MKKVFLTYGPRGAGKSTYVDRISKDSGKVVVVSRDEILISLFEGTLFSSYGGEHEYAEFRMFEKLQELLSEENKTEIIILDCWNGYPSSRREIIKKMREFGADEVHCLLFFITPELCLDWFSKKPDASHSSSSGIIHDLNLYYAQAGTIEDDGFDTVIPIISNQRELDFA